MCSTQNDADAIKVGVWSNHTPHFRHTITPLRR